MYLSRSQYSRAKYGTRNSSANCKEGTRPCRGGAWQSDVALLGLWSGAYHAMRGWRSHHAQEVHRFWNSTDFVEAFLERDHDLLSLPFKSKSILKHGVNPWRRSSQSVLHNSTKTVLIHILASIYMFPHPSKTCGSDLMENRATRQTNHESAEFALYRRESLEDGHWTRHACGGSWEFSSLLINSRSMLVGMSARATQ